MALIIIHEVWLGRDRRLGTSAANHHYAALPIFAVDADKGGYSLWPYRCKRLVSHVRFAKVDNACRKNRLDRLHRRVHVYFRSWATCMTSKGLP